MAGLLFGVALLVLEGAWVWFLLKPAQWCDWPEEVLRVALALVWPVWIATESIATTIGVVRVASGSHFPSDVLVGAAAGVGFGLLVPWLHERPEQTTVQVHPLLSPDAAGLVGSFTWSE